MNEIMNEYKRDDMTVINKIVLKNEWNLLYILMDEVEMEWEIKQ